MILPEFSQYFRETDSVAVGGSRIDCVAESIKDLIRIVAPANISRFLIVRILSIIHHYLDPNSGAPGATLRINEAYRRLGHEVETYSFEDMPRSISDRLKPFVFPFYVAANIRRLRRLHEIDVIEAVTGDAWVFALRRSAKPRSLLVTRTWGLEHRYYLEELKERASLGRPFSRRHRLLTRFFTLPSAAMSLRRSDLALMINREDRDYSIAHLRVSEQSAVLACGFGLADELVGLAFQPTSALSYTTLRIAVIAAFHERKGINYAMPALGKLLKEYSILEVSFFGTGCDAARVLERLPEEVRSRVTVIPRYEYSALPTLLIGHQIKLLASVAEGSGISLVEAMACGLAPVAVDTQGPREIISNGVDGLLIPPRDASAIVSAVARLIEDRGLLDRLRRKAYAKAQDYSWVRVAANTLSLYERLLQRNQDTKAA